MTPTIPDEAVQAMPERIYAVKQTEGSDCVVSFASPSLDYNIEYIRADLTLPFLTGVKPGDLVNEAEILASDMPHTVVKKLDAAYEARILSAIDVSASDCHCTKIQQDESCPIGYPSLLCEICDGKGVVPSPRAQALEEAAKIAEAYIGGEYEAQGRAAEEIASELRALSSQPVADGSERTVSRALRSVAVIPASPGASE